MTYLPDYLEIKRLKLGKVIEDWIAIAGRQFRPAPRDRIRSSGSSAYSTWGANIDHEVGFWTAWFRATGEKNWSEHDKIIRLDRLRTDKVFPDWCKERIPNAGELVRFLDVGSGPIPALGDFWPGHTVEMVAVDPLADSYDELLKEYAKPVQGKAIKGDGEKLLEMFEENSFDMAYSSNALDHSYDPFRCYENMVRLVKPGCWVITFNAENEAKNQRYEGLHQWNFYKDRDSYMIEGHGQIIDVGLRLKPYIQKIEIEQRQGWLQVSIQKR